MIVCLLTRRTFDDQVWEYYLLIIFGVGASLGLPVLLESVLYKGFVIARLTFKLEDGSVDVVTM